jgi:hypothetical protein
MTAHIVTVAEDAHAARGELRRRFAGRLSVAGEPGYDEGRAGVNPRIDAHPPVVAEAQSPLDVSVAITWAGERQQPLTVQSTGHGTHVSAEGGVLLKTSAMTRVLVDPDVTRPASFGLRKNPSPEASGSCAIGLQTPMGCQTVLVSTKAASRLVPGSPIQSW